MRTKYCKAKQFVQTLDSFMELVANADHHERLPVIKELIGRIVDQPKFNETCVDPPTSQSHHIIQFLDLYNTTCTNYSHGKLTNLIESSLFDTLLSIYNELKGKGHAKKFEKA